MADSANELLLCTITTAGLSLHPPCDCLALVLLLYECFTTATVAKNQQLLCFLAVCLETASLCAGQLRGLWCVTAEQGAPSVMINRRAEATDLCPSKKKTQIIAQAGSSCCQACVTAVRACCGCCLLGDAVDLWAYLFGLG